MYVEYMMVGKNDQVFLDSVPQVTLGRLYWDLILQHDRNKVAEINTLTNAKVTFSQLCEQSKRFSLWMKNNKCQPGDLVLTCFGNELFFTPIMLSCLWSGYILSPINPFFNIEDFQLLLNNLKPRVIVCIKNVLPTLKEACQNINLSPYFVLIDGEEANEDNNVYSIEEIWNKRYREESSFQPYDVAPEELKTHCIMILCSSGSTGLPKGVRHTDSSFVYCMHSSMRIKDSFLTNDIPVTLSAGYWVTGILFRLSALYFGLTNAIMPNFTCDHFCQSVQKIKITRALMSPACVSALAKFNVKPYNLKSLRLINFGGAAIAEELRKLAEKNLGVCFQNMYGMTEILVMMAPFNGEPGGSPTSVGRVLTGTQAKIISPETGLTLPPNERGELCIKSPTLMQGYHNNTKATKETIDEQNWLHSGDVAYYNEDGWFFVVDRIKELIKYKGNHVAGSEIEAVLILHPSVSEVCVIGIPHEVDWEHPKAFVIRTANAKATETDLQQFVKDRMPEYKQLHGGVQFVDELPKTSTGKIKRADLRKLHKP